MKFIGWLLFVLFSFNSIAQISDNDVLKVLQTHSRAEATGQLQTASGVVAEELAFYMSPVFITMAGVASFVALIGGLKLVRGQIMRGTVLK